MTANMFWRAAERRAGVVFQALYRLVALSLAAKTRSGTILRTLQHYWPLHKEGFNQRTV